MKERSRSALELLEEAIHLFRNASSGAILAYYAGTVPFVLFFLFYWADMSSSASAQEHLIETSLALALLFVWMKTWHAAFAFLIRKNLLADDEMPLTLGRCWRMAVAQAIIQPSCLFLLPLSSILVLPSGWAYAFYKNVTVIGNGEHTKVRQIIRESWKSAGVWPKQNHKILCIFFLFSIVVFLNVGILILTVPGLIHMFFGIETSFTRSGIHILNTTFLMSAAGISYLFLNPLSICIYVLRCFYAESQQTGADLRVQLRLTANAYE